MPSSCNRMLQTLLRPVNCHQLHQLAAAAGISLSQLVLGLPVCGCKCHVASSRGGRVRACRSTATLTLQHAISTVGTDHAQ
jgi:hypothetical protein